MKKRKLSPTRLIAIGFFALIFVGAGLLMLPFASKTDVTFLDALFTATSATCVTGLIVRDTFTTWTWFGQAVIITLIQIGGLGLMTVITLFSFAMGKKLALYDRKVLMQSAGNMQLSGVGGLIRRIVPFAFVVELIGAALLAIRFVPEFGWPKGIWFSVFHSVSAFCNAGFDLMGGKAPFSSLTSYAKDPVVTLTVAALIILGGLGFLVWRDVTENRLRWKKLQLHTKIVLVSSSVLLFGGWVLFLIFEWNASLDGLSVTQKLTAAFFQSATPRTAGFNTTDLNALSESGNLLTNVLMLIGGSPGSTAGGIKTTTVAVLLLSMLVSARGRRRVNAFRFRIDNDTLRQASSILHIYLSIAIVSLLVICALEPITVKQALFEINSAIATVGLTLGVTPKLCAASKILLMLLMYAGRLGGLTFAMVFTEAKTEAPIDRPAGKLLIG